MKFVYWALVNPLDVFLILFSSVMLGFIVSAILNMELLLIFLTLIFMVLIFVTFYIREGIDIPKKILSEQHYIEFRVYQAEQKHKEEEKEKQKRKLEEEREKQLQEREKRIKLEIQKRLAEKGIEDEG